MPVLTPQRAGHYLPATYAFTAGKPSLPSTVFTPASHLSSTPGFAFSHWRAALFGSVLFMIGNITWFSISVVNCRFDTSFATLGQRVEYSVEVTVSTFASP